VKLRVLSVFVKVIYNKEEADANKCCLLQNCCTTIDTLHIYVSSRQQELTEILNLKPL